MRALLDNRFAPLTFSFGFIEGPFDKVSQTFVEWQLQIDKKFGTSTKFKRFEAPLAESLLALDPLSAPTDSYLLTATRSGWTAIFANGLRANDVASPVGYLPRVLGGRGLSVSCVPDRSKMAGRDGLQIYGSIKFCLNGPTDTDWLNRIRLISLSKDVGGWEFIAQGEVQPYEQIENYERRHFVDRFTPDLLESYCAALGIDLFSSHFYGDQCLLSRNQRMRNPGVKMSIREARSHVYLEGDFPTSRESSRNLKRRILEFFGRR